MNTKSAIQLTLEIEDIKNYFKQSLVSLTEHYEVNGNVFYINSTNQPTEAIQGYFVEEKTYDSLNDCIKDMKLNQAVSINEGKYILGRIEQHLTNCDEDKKVLDIEYLQYIR